MPKNKKPAGGRAAKNFDPRYNPKYRAAKEAGRARDDEPKRRPGEASVGKPGSRSPGHRGYRETQGDASPKRRWSEQERVGRDESRAIRTHARDGRIDSAPQKAPHDRDRRPADRDRRPDAAGTRREPVRGRRAPERAGTRPAAPQRLDAQAVAPGELADATFGDLGLGQNIVKVLDELGATA